MIQEITNYRIDSLIGKGGMATVYLADHRLLLNKVAIKILHPEYIRNENIRKRFLAEARNMARMSHPNLVKVTDLIEEGETVAFVMEYVEGETLKEYLERKIRLNDEEIDRIFTQMLDAVGYVHEQNLVHRDIKPSNFMLDTKGNVKLMDFGIAKNTDASAAEYTQTSTGMQMGTPMYMSPEQITESRSVTAVSDIYSIGVVLWQMVMGKKPYDMASISNYELQNLIVKAPLQESLTSWDSLINKATDKDPKNRFQSTEAFRIAFSNMKTVSKETDVENKKNEKHSDSKSDVSKTKNGVFNSRFVLLTGLMFGLAGTVYTAFSYSMADDNGVYFIPTWMFVLSGVLLVLGLVRNKTNV